MTQKYHLTYDIERHKDGIAKDKIPEGHGACDHVILCSIIDSSDGGVSRAFVSMNGKTGEALEPIELFQAWVMLAMQLSQTLTHKHVQKALLCKHVFETVRSWVLEARGLIKPDPNEVH